MPGQVAFHAGRSLCWSDQPLRRVSTVLGPSSQLTAEPLSFMLFLFWAQTRIIDLLSNEYERTGQTVDARDYEHYIESIGFLQLLGRIWFSLDVPALQFFLDSARRVLENKVKAPRKQRPVRVSERILGLEPELIYADDQESERNEAYELERGSRIPQDVECEDDFEDCRPSEDAPITTVYHSAFHYYSRLVGGSTPDSAVVRWNGMTHEERLPFIVRSLRLR